MRYPVDCQEGGSPGCGFPAATGGLRLPDPTNGRLGLSFYWGPRTALKVATRVFIFLAAPPMAPNPPRSGPAKPDPSLLLHEVPNQRQRRVEGEAPSGFARGGGDASPYNTGPHPGGASVKSPSWARRVMVSAGRSARAAFRQVALESPRSGLPPSWEEIL